MEEEVTKPNTNLSHQNLDSPQNSTPDDVQNAFQKVVEKKPEKALEMMQVMMAGMTSSENPLHNKINEEHVTKIIDLTSKHDERQYDLCKRNQDNERLNQWQLLIVFGLVFVLIAIILFLYRDQPAVLVPILTGVGGLVSGFIGGFGYGKSRK